MSTPNIEFDFRKGVAWWKAPVYLLKKHVFMKMLENLAVSGSDFNIQIKISSIDPCDHKYKELHTLDLTCGKRHLGAILEQIGKFIR